MHLGATWGLLVIYAVDCGSLSSSFSIIFGVDAGVIFFPNDSYDFIQLWGEPVATSLALGGHFGAT